MCFCESNSNMRRLESGHWDESVKRHEGQYGVVAFPPCLSREDARVSLPQRQHNKPFIFGLLWSCVLFFFYTDWSRFFLRLCRAHANLISSQGITFVAVATFKVFLMCSKHTCVRARQQTKPKRQNRRRCRCGSRNRPPQVWTQSDLHDYIHYVSNACLTSIGCKESCDFCIIYGWKEWKKEAVMVLSPP